MFAYFQPFLDPKETILEVLALFAIFICLLLGLMFRTGIAGDSDDAELPSAYTTPLLFLAILLPVGTAVMMVIHDVSGAFEDAKAAKELRRQRRSSITSVEPENLEKSDGEEKGERKKKKKRKKRDSEMKRDSNAGRLAASPPLP